jgi:hypothetical protein
MTIEEEQEEEAAIEAAAVLTYNNEEQWIENYYNWSSNIQDPDKRKHFRAFYDRYILEEPTWCSNYFSDIPERRLAAKANYEARTMDVGRRVLDVRRNIIEMERQGIKNPDSTALMNELLGKIATAKQQQQD